MILLEEFQKIRLSKHLIVLDTNIFLELYRQPSNISLDIIEALKQIMEQIYVPRQVYDEYLRNYQKICGEEKKKYQNVRRELFALVTKLQDDIKSRTTEYRKHNYTDISKLQSDLGEKLAEAIDIIKAYENNHKEEIEKNIEFLQSDKVKEFVELLNEQGKIEKQLTFSEKLSILQEGKIRFENLIPPGYMDQEKDGMDKYGDLFVWKSIIKAASEKNANILFICNDKKEDWWEQNKENLIDLRKELWEEFKENRPLLEIHFLTLEKFFSYIAEELKIGQSKSALQLSAMDYAEKNIEAYKDQIMNKIENFFASVNIDDILKGELLSNTDDAKIYWNIRDVSVEKEEKTIQYYINLDISILADLICRENEELSSDKGKVAVALEGRLSVAKEEYSKENYLDTIDINIIEVFHIEPDIWGIIGEDSENDSCREIIAASKELLECKDNVLQQHKWLKKAGVLETAKQYTAISKALGLAASSQLYKPNTLYAEMMQPSVISQMLRTNTEVEEMIKATTVSQMHKPAAWYKDMMDSSIVSQILRKNAGYAKTIEPLAENSVVSKALGSSESILKMAKSPAVQNAVSKFMKPNEENNK